MVESDADQYERLVGCIVDEIRKRIPSLSTSSLRGGRECHITGASGFPHQIDVAIESPNHIVLVECKHWTKNIDPEAVLVLTARRADIQDSNPSGCQVEALFATKVGASRGVKLLAKHFELDVGIVSSESEFALRVASHVSVGVSDGAIASDSAEAEVFRRNK